METRRPGGTATTPLLRGVAGGRAAIVSARRRSIGHSHRTQPAFVPTKLERKIVNGIAPPAMGVAASPSFERALQPACFASRADLRGLLPLEVRLRTVHAEGLARLLPLLLCGEESAALAFAQFAELAVLDRNARAQLSRMRLEEERHEVWLTRLRMGLPAPKPERGLRRIVRHFFLAIREPEVGAHLGRIASLDSAVCVILGALRHPRCALAADADLRRLLTRIHFEEAGHSRTASYYARIFGASDLRWLAIDTRERLTRLLALRAVAFDQVGVCPDRLSRRLLQVPRRLFV
jgi:hypothetical protein